MTRELLDSIAEDFTKTLNAKCKVYQESGMYSIGIVDEKTGSYRRVTQTYGKRALAKASLDMLEGIRLGRELNKFPLEDNGVPILFK